MSDLFPQLSDLVPLLPGAATGGAFLGAACWIKKERVAAVVAGLGVIATAAITWWQVRGELPFSTTQSSERGFWGLIACAAIASLTMASRRTSMWFGLLAAVVAAGYWIVTPLVDREPDDPSRIGLGVALGVGAVLGAVALGSARSASRAPAFALPLVLSTAVGATGQVLFLFGSASLAQMAGAFGVACGLAALVGLGKRTMVPAAAGAVVAAGAMFAIDGWAFLDDTPSLVSLLLLLAVPLTPWLGELGKLRESTPFVKTAWIVGVASVLAGIAVGIAIAEMPAPDPYADAYK